MTYDELMATLDQAIQANGQAMILTIKVSEEYDFDSMDQNDLQGVKKNLAYNHETLSGLRGMHERGQPPQVTEGENTMLMAKLTLRIDSREDFDEKTLDRLADSLEEVLDRAKNTLVGVIEVQLPRVRVEWSEQ